MPVDGKTCCCECCVDAGNEIGSSIVGTKGYFAEWCWWCGWKWLFIIGDADFSEWWWFVLRWRLLFELLESLSYLLLLLLLLEWWWCDAVLLEEFILWCDPFECCPFDDGDFTNAFGFLIKFIIF